VVEHLASKCDIIVILSLLSLFLLSAFGHLFLFLFMFSIFLLGARYYGQNILEAPGNSSSYLEEWIFFCWDVRSLANEYDPIRVKFQVLLGLVYFQFELTPE
jgi:hypothetical protein